MGQALTRLISGASDLRIIAGIGRAPAEGAAAQAFGCPVIVNVVDAAGLVGDADVVIDFSTPEATHDLLLHADSALVRRALVVGTTGLHEDTVNTLDSLSHYGAVMTAANFSVGVNVLLALAERMAAVLDPRSYDAEIVETHHSGKTDAPSGTALAFGEAIARGRHAKLPRVRRDGRTGHTGERPKGEIGFHSIRGGNVIGEHRVMFIGPNERVELVHEAGDRTLFAEGALRAARWVTGRPPGRYSMADVLGFER